MITDPTIDGIELLLMGSSKFSGSGCIRLNSPAPLNNCPSGHRYKADNKLRSP
jgi:hypothetical protein